MIIKKDYLNKNNNYLEMEKEGLEKAINNFDKRFKNKEIERTNFLKGLEEFSKKQIDLNKRINKEAQNKK
ncbi:MAG: hypothetical protein IJ068_05975 [Bacilli bacterium]|nr:hypothetical protein [Bacilli bacterium]